MKTLESVIYVIAVFAAVQFIDNMILKTVIFSQTVDLHPLIVVVVLVFGGVLAGMWGLVLAVPVAGAVQVVTTQVLMRVRRSGK